jgi:hypothetical protein
MAGYQRIGLQMRNYPPRKIEEIIPLNPGTCPPLCPTPICLPAEGYFTYTLVRESSTAFRYRFYSNPTGTVTEAPVCLRKAEKYGFIWSGTPAYIYGAFGGQSGLFYDLKYFETVSAISDKIYGHVAKDEPGWGTFIPTCTAPCILKQWDMGAVITTYCALQQTGWVSVYTSLNGSDWDLKYDVDAGAAYKDGLVDLGSFRYLRLYAQNADARIVYFDLILESKLLKMYKNEQYTIAPQTDCWKDVLFFWFLTTDVSDKWVFLLTDVATEPSYYGIGISRRYLRTSMYLTRTLYSGTINLLPGDILYISLMGLGLGRVTIDGITPGWKCYPLIKHLSYSIPKAVNVVVEEGRDCDDPNCWCDCAIYVIK